MNKYIQIDARDSGGKTALHLACSEGHYHSDGEQNEFCGDDYDAEFVSFVDGDNRLRCVWF